MNMVEPSNIVVILINVIFFMIIQIIFFKHILSKKINDVIVDKTNIFNMYIQHNKVLGNEIEKYMSSEHRNRLKVVAREQKADRDNYNNTSANIWVYIPIIMSIFALSYFLYKIYTSPNRESIQENNGYVSLVLPVILYICGILIFYYVIDHHEYYGDHELFSRIYSTICNNITKTCTTIPGEKLCDDVKKVAGSNITLMELIENHPDLATSLFDVAGSIKHNSIVKYMYN
jgi:hypothetical protein